MTEYLKILEATAILEKALKCVSATQERNDVSNLADALLNETYDKVSKAIAFLEDIDVEKLVEEEKDDE